MSKTKLQALTEIIERVLHQYRFQHVAFAWRALRREIALKIARAVRSAGVSPANRPKPRATRCCGPYGKTYVKER